MITITLISIAAILNALMDTISFRYESSIFSNFPRLRQFLDVNMSWRNKYKGGDVKQGRAFFGSTTFLVFLTDGWHLFKTLMLLYLLAAMVSYETIVSPMADILIYYVWFGIVFEVFFAYILKKRNT
jgi:hypothetical protein